MDMPHILNKAVGSYVDLPSYLLEHRTLFLGPELTTAMASMFAMQILALLQEEGSISVYINCYGGSVPAGLAIADMVDHANAGGRPVHTYAIGECVGVAALVLAAGKRGERRAFPSARVSLYQEWYGVESVWGAMSQDDQERTRLLQVIEERMLRLTRIGELDLKEDEEREIELGEEGWEELQAAFPEDEALQGLAVERDGKLYLGVRAVLAARDLGRVGEEAAAEVVRRATSGRLHNWFQRLEFLSPEQALSLGLIDGVVEQRRSP